MTPRGGSRGTRTHKRCWPPPVFKTGSSSGRMASVVKLRGSESNQRPPGSEPGVTTSSNYPGSCFLSGHHFVPMSSGRRNRTLVSWFKAKGLAISRSPSERKCPAGVEPASPDWKPGASAARPRARQSGRRGTRTLKAHRSAAFQAAAVADRLALPSGKKARTSSRSTATFPAAILTIENPGGECKSWTCVPVKCVSSPCRLRASSQSAPAGGVEPPIFGLTGRRLSVWPHRIS